MMQGKITAEGIINSALAMDDEMKGSEFPLHVFPTQFQKIARGTAVGLGFPLDFIAGSMLFASAVAIGSTHCIQVKEGWQEFPLLYLALVGKAGTNKSHPMSFAMSPIFKCDGEHYKTFRQHYKEYQQLMSLSKKEREEQGVAEHPEAPHQKRFVVSDITPEALTYIHEQNPRGLCLYADELKLWINNFNRYSKGSEEEFWLSNFSGKPITIDRRNVENSTRMERTLISVIGSIQLMQLKDLAKGDKSYNGFLDRILFLVPRRLEKEYWSEEDLAPELHQRWLATLTELMNLEFTTNEFGDPQPTVLRFSADARKRIYQWQHHNTDLCNSEFDERVGGIYSKLEIYVSRFALVLQLIRWAFAEGSKTAIDTESVEGAISIVEYFRANVIRVVDYLYGCESDKLSEAQQALLNALPETFTTAEGVAIAARFKVNERTFKRFIKSDYLFRRERHGVYTKIV